MSDKATIARKNQMISGNQDKNGYAATEELHYDDIEAVAKAVLRQRKISATVSNHLTPQFAEYDRSEQDKLSRRSKATAPTDASSINNKISVDADVFESVLIGLSQLLDSQRRFADEFGLKQEAVFSSSIIRDMQKRGSSAVLRELLHGDQKNSSSKLDALFEDLAHHQAGLLASLDTIARRTIKYLGPELTEKSVKGLSRLGPIWPRYRERNKKISADKQSRYKVIIAPGVAYGYSKIKEKLTNKLKK